MPAPGSPASPPGAAAATFAATFAAVVLGAADEIVPGSKALPRPLRDELSRRRAQLLGRVEGTPYLDLGGILQEAAAPAVPGETYRAVVAVGRLSTHPDPAAWLAACFGLLHPNGRLLIVEPYRRPGLFGRVQAVAAPTVARRFGYRIDLPVPALVRAAGFVIATVERFTMPTHLVPLRPFMFVDARAGIVPTVEVAL